MSTMHFMVTVEVERDQGKFVSRDELSEAIIEALNDAPDQASLSSLGADGTSDYSVVQTDVEYLEPKDRKAIYAEYDQAVIAELPGDAELRAQIKELRKELHNAQFQAQNWKQKAEQLAADRKVGATRIYQTEGYGSDIKHYFADGKLDSVYFQRGERDYDRWEIRLQEDGSLLLRTDTMQGNMAVMPRSGNEMTLRMVDR